MMRRLNLSYSAFVPQLTLARRCDFEKSSLWFLFRFLLIFLIVYGCEHDRPSTAASNIPDSTVLLAGADEPIAGDLLGGEGACIPECEGRACGIDPRCGVSCGTCSNGSSCEATHCVPDVNGGTEPQGSGMMAGITSDGGVNACDVSCESLAAECGEVCGEVCGSCSNTARCEQGRCVCTPQCAGQACGAPDGCGGLCSPCPRSESCEECALQLRVVSQEERDGQVIGARVALSLHFQDGSPHPEIADLHLDLTGPVVLGRVGLSATLAGVGKQLIPNPATGLPYRVDGDRYRFMIMSTQNTEEIPSGDWLFLDLLIGDTSAAPVQVKVVQHEQTFAPPPADLQLWGASLGEALVIWPALSQGE